jgi:hypothetical protein
MGTLLKIKTTISALKNRSESYAGIWYSSGVKTEQQCMARTETVRAVMEDNYDIFTTITALKKRSG